MATFDFQLDESFVGQIIGPENGFLSSLRRTAVGLREEPQFSASKQIWIAGYFVLRASGDTQNLICIGPFDTIPTMLWAREAGPTVISAS